MQIVITALCKKGNSLREAIAGDDRLDAFRLQVVKQLQPGRSPGWLKIRSTERQRGAINVQWDGQAQVLTARVVTRGSRAPSAIVGDFINYLLARHGRRVVAITTAQR